MGDAISGGNLYAIQMVLTTKHRVQYRGLWRAGHAAVLDSVIGKRVIRAKLRGAFREPRTKDVDDTAVENTITLLTTAAKHKGTEHKLIKSLVFVHWGRHVARRRPLRADRNMQDNVWARQAAYEEFDWTLEMLNKSMRLCLR